MHLFPNPSERTVAKLQAKFRLKAAYLQHLELQALFGMGMRVAHLPLNLANPNPETQRTPTWLTNEQRRAKSQLTVAVTM